MWAYSDDSFIQSHWAAGGRNSETTSNERCSGGSPNSGRCIWTPGLTSDAYFQICLHSRMRGAYFCLCSLSSSFPIFFSFLISCILSHLPAICHLKSSNQLVPWRNNYWCTQVGNWSPSEFLCLSKPTHSPCVQILVGNSFQLSLEFICMPSSDWWLQTHCNLHPSLPLHTFLLKPH